METANYGAKKQSYLDSEYLLADVVSVVHCVPADCGRLSFEGQGCSEWGSFVPEGDGRRTKGQSMNWETEVHPWTAC